MEQAQIFKPLFAVIRRTAAVWGLMDARRISFIQSSDNLKNLFSTPSTRDSGLSAVVGG